MASRRPPTTPAISRVWKYVDRRGPDECWLWTGAQHPKGSKHARSLIHGGPGERSSSASRVILADKLGRPLRDDEEACHSCDVPLCCNPAHLWPGTHAENQADMVRKGRSRGAPQRVTPAEVVAIRNAEGSTKDVAARFGISESYARAIRDGSKRTKELSSAEREAVERLRTEGRTDLCLRCGASMKGKLRHAIYCSEACRHAVNYAIRRRNIAAQRGLVDAPIEDKT